MMKLLDVLGLGYPDGKTVIPLSVWLPVLVVVSVLAALLLTSMDDEGVLTQSVVLVGTGVVVAWVATGITLRRNRRR